MGVPGHRQAESGSAAPLARRPVGVALAAQKGSAAGGAVTSERRGGEAEPALPCKAVVNLPWLCPREGAAENSKRGRKPPVTEAPLLPFGGRDGGSSVERTRKPLQGDLEAASQFS